MTATDDSSGETPTPEPLLDLFFGDISLPLLKLPILRAGVELQVWHAIGAGNRTVPAIATAVGADATGIRLLLDALTVMKLLCKDATGYSLPPWATRYLLPDKPTYLGDFVLEWLAWERHGRLADAIRTGRRPIIADVTRPESVQHFLPYYAIRALSPRDYLSRYEDYWQTLQVEPRPGLRVLDLACGAGIATLALAMRCPTVHVTLQDWPAMLDLADQASRLLGVSDQVTLLPGDMLTLDYGPCQFDVARLGFVTYFFGTDDLERLFRSVLSTLSPGGALVLEAPLCDECRCEREEEVLDGPWLYAVSAGGDVYSFLDYKKLLERTGFDGVSAVSESLVLAFRRS